MRIILLALTLLPVGCGWTIPTAPRRGVVCHSAPDDFTRSTVRPYLVRLKVSNGTSQAIAEAETDAFLADPISDAFVAKFRRQLDEQAQTILEESRVCSPRPTAFSSDYDEW